MYNLIIHPVNFEESCKMKGKHIILCYDCTVQLDMSIIAW
jgi:hypothetical protein